MTCKEIMITHEIGLTAKAAAVFVATANEYASQISVEFKNFKINGKSIMGVLSLGAKKGDTIFVPIVIHSAVNFITINGFR